MSKIAVAIAVVAAVAIAPPTMGYAQAPAPAHFVPPPGAAPPWAGTTTAATEPPAAPTPTSLSAPDVQPPPPGKTDNATPVPVAAMPTEGTTPMQGSTTPIRVVSLRAGPNGNAPVIGTLHPGDQLEILGTANYGWTEVRSSTGTGWAYGSYLASGISAVARVNGSVVPATTGAAAEQ